MFMLSIFTLSVFLFPNSMFYTVLLLCFVLNVCSGLFSAGLINPLTSLILILVYVGAIIILVGYICAVTPNLTSRRSFSAGSAFLFLLVSVFAHSSAPLSTNPDFQGFPLTYFYSEGVLIFATIVFMLFVTLLIVTSQYSTPQGPFRSF